MKKMAATTRIVTLLLVAMMVTLLTVNGVAYGLRPGNSGGPLVDNDGLLVTVQGSEVSVTYSYGSGSGFIIAYGSGSGFIVEPGPW